MSFEVDYNQDGTVKNMTKTEPVFEEAPVQQIPEPESEDVEESNNNEEENVDNADIEEEESDPVPVPTKKAVKDSWSELREKAFRAEKRTQELELEIQRSREKKKDPEPELDYGLGDDDLVEGRHVSAMRREMNAIKQELKQYKYQTVISSAETRLKSQYSDFDSVVSSKNIERLKQEHPEVAQTLASSGDMYASGKSAYMFIKSLGYAAKDVRPSHDRVRAINNSAKPKSSSSIKSQGPQSPLSQVNRFAEDGNVSRERQEMLVRQMNSAIENM